MTASRTGVSFALCLLHVALAPSAQARPAVPALAPGARVGAARTDDEPKRARIAITLAGDPDCASALGAVLTGQLGDVAATVTWSCQTKLDADEPFRERADSATDVRVWVNLSPAHEARVTLQDGRGSRYFLRRLPLPSGVGEIAREEIADVVRSGTIAVLTGAAGAVSRAEARVTASRWPAPEQREGEAPVVIGQGNARSSGLPVAPPLFELGPAWTAQTLARGLPFVQEVALTASLSARSRRISFWTEAGYRLPASDAGASVGVRLTAFTLRAGATWWTSPEGVLRLGLGGGLGVRRVWFAPQGDATAVDAATPDHFDTLAGRVLVALQLQASARVVLRLDVLCDVATADVHYDLKTGSGIVERALTQWPVQPGLSLAAAWLWGV